MPNFLVKTPLFLLFFLNSVVSFSNDRLSEREIVSLSESLVTGSLFLKKSISKIVSEKSSPNFNPFELNSFLSNPEFQKVVRNNVQKIKGFENLKEVFGQRFSSLNQRQKSRVLAIYHILELLILVEDFRKISSYIKVPFSPLFASYLNLCFENPLKKKKYLKKLRKTTGYTFDIFYYRKIQSQVHSPQKPLDFEMGVDFYDLKMRVEQSTNSTNKSMKIDFTRLKRQDELVSAHLFFERDSCIHKNRNNRQAYPSYKIKGTPVSESYSMPQNRVYFSADGISSSNPVVVGLIDDGIDKNHPMTSELIARDKNGAYVYYDGLEKSTILGDQTKHGTFIAPIIAKDIDDLKIIPVNKRGGAGGLLVSGLVKKGQRTYLMNTAEKVAEERVLREFEFLSENGVRIVNMSFERPLVEKGNYSLRNDLVENFLTPNMYYNSMPEKYPDILFVKAAGNDPVDRDKIFGEFMKGENVLVVTSVHRDGRLSDNNAWGKVSVDLAALGENITSANAGKYSDGRMTRTDSGTSFAAPQVTNVAAKILQINSKFKAKTIAQIICKTVTRTKELVAKTRCGGYLNEQAAIRLAKEQSAAGLL